MIYMYSMETVPTKCVSDKTFSRQIRSPAYTIFYNFIERYRAPDVSLVILDNVIVPILHLI